MGPPLHCVRPVAHCTPGTELKPPASTLPKPTALSPVEPPPEGLKPAAVAIVVLIAVIGSRAAVIFALMAAFEGKVMVGINWVLFMTGSAGSIMVLLKMPVLFMAGSAVMVLLTAGNIIAMSVLLRKGGVVLFRAGSMVGITVVLFMLGSIRFVPSMPCSTILKPQAPRDVPNVDIQRTITHTYHDRRAASLISLTHLNLLQISCFGEAEGG